MKKLMSRLLLLTIALSILILSGYGNPYLQGDQISGGYAIAKTKNESTSALSGIVKANPVQANRNLASAYPKKKKFFILDPAEIEEDELDPSKKFLGGKTLFLSVFNIQSQNHYAVNAIQRSLFFSTQSSNLISDKRHLLLQVFRI